MAPNACDEIAEAALNDGLLEDVTAVSPRRCKQSRIAHATLPARATAPVERSEALGSSRCNFQAARNSLQLQRSASASDWPEPRPC